MAHKRRYLLAVGVWKVTIFFMTSYVRSYSYFRDREFKILDFEVED